MMPVVLLMLFSVAVSIGVLVGAFVLKSAAKERKQPSAAHKESVSGAAVYDIPEQLLEGLDDPVAEFSRRPESWLAIKSRNLHAVKAAFGLHNIKPCPVTQGLAGTEKIFIAPPMGNWIVVTGSALPDLADDVDAFFRFLLELSRRLGHVQFFRANPVLNHHAWIKAHKGRFLRAYAWAGRTIWKQGRMTAAEQELGMRCFEYFQEIERSFSGEPDPAAANTEKVGYLAARWSLDPCKLGSQACAAERGLAGEASLIF